MSKKQIDTFVDKVFIPFLWKESKKEFQMYDKNKEAVGEAKNVANINYDLLLIFSLDNDGTIDTMVDSLYFGQSGGNFKDIPSPVTLATWNYFLEKVGEYLAFRGVKKSEETPSGFASFLIWKSQVVPRLEHKPYEYTTDMFPREEWYFSMRYGQKWKQEKDKATYVIALANDQVDLFVPQ